MTVELLAKIVEDLILDGDEVNLPGLGVFVARLEPATFTDRGYTLNPPYRRLGFEQRDSDDRSIVSAYARDNGIGEDRAEALLRSFLTGLGDTVLKESAVALPGLGRLRAARDGRIFFIPDEDLDISFDGVRLEPVSLKAHHGQASPRTIFAELPDDEALNPVPEPETPAPAPAPVAEPEPETPAPAPVAVPVTTAAADGADPGYRALWWMIPVILLCIAVFALAVFLILVQVAPDFVDSILYTPEELLIINS